MSFLSDHVKVIPVTVPPPKPKTDVAKAHVQWDDDLNRWMILLPDGEIDHKRDAGDVVRRVRRFDRARAKANPGKIIVTVLEWHDVPADFVPPENNR